MRHPLRASMFVLVLLGALAALAPAALGQRLDARLGALAHPEAQWAILLPSTPATIENVFGSAVAIDGDTAVVGSPWSGELSRGSASVFVRDGASWTFQAELVAPDLAVGNNLGLAVALQGDTAVIAAPSQDAGRGAVYVFTRSGATWTLQQKLTAGDAAAGDQFGYSVAISGGAILVGAPLCTIGSEPTQGAVYAFTSDGTTWTQQQKLTSSDGYGTDEFGKALAMDGDTALIGASFKMVGAGQGAAYVFTRSGAAWSQQQELTAADGAGGDQFGRHVALSGDTALIGAPRKPVSGDLPQGAAYVFTRSGTTWSLQTRLVDEAGAAGEGFGDAVGLSGDTAAVGAGSADTGYPRAKSGAVFVYTRSWSTWSQPQKLYASDISAADLFGTALAMSGKRIIIGAPDKTVGGVDQAGEAYIFAPAFYAITPSVISGHGDVKPGGVQTVTGGRDQVFTFTPDAGYHVAQVKVDGAVVTPTPTAGYTFATVCDDHTVAVTFAPDKPALATLSRKAGKRGAVVVLTGAGFGARRGTSYVKFGGVHCTRYLSWSDTRIKCKVPAHAKLGKRMVKVHTLAGLSNAKAFRVKR
jgi:hypothetical protein